jgi:hypothetical protein
VTGRIRLVGAVVAFDDKVGRGDVETEPAAGPNGRSRPVRYSFHSTQIADGSRRVAVGARVSFELVPGRGGRWEAAALRPRV